MTVIQYVTYRKVSYPAVTRRSVSRVRALWMRTGKAADSSADLKMRHFAHWSNTSKHLGVSHSSKDTSVITEAIRNGIRAGKLPLLECLNKCVRSEGVIQETRGPALMQKEQRVEKEQKHVLCADAGCGEATPAGLEPPCWQTSILLKSS